MVGKFTSISTEITNSVNPDPSVRVCILSGKPLMVGKFSSITFLVFLKMKSTDNGFLQQFSPSSSYEPTHQIVNRPQQWHLQIFQHVVWAKTALLLQLWVMEQWDCKQLFLAYVIVEIDDCRFM
jgi:hypothetical protein